MDEKVGGTTVDKLGRYLIISALLVYFGLLANGCYSQPQPSSGPHPSQIGRYQFLVAPDGHTGVWIIDTTTGDVWTEVPKTREYDHSYQKDK